jgi:dipeptidyl-peptidase-4
MRLRQILPATLFLTVSAPALAAAEDLTIEALHQEAGLSGPSLRGAAFSPDGRTITLLKGREGDARTLDLWAYDVETGEGRVLVRADDLVSGEAELSEEEKNRRERQRIYDSGIISYQWDSAGERILFPLGGDLYLYDVASGSPVQVTDTEAFETDPKMSPDGGFVSYVRDDELYVYDISSGRERRVTRGADGTIRNAVAEFVAQEELDRDTGYWWAPGDDLIAYTQIDESPVDIAERLDFGTDGASTIRQRYPFAGTDNVKIRMGITTPGGGRTKWIDLGEDEDIYVADAQWSKDGETLYVSRLSRDQKTLDILAVDPKSGSSTVAHTERSESWINLLGRFHMLEDGGFLRLSEASGWSHIYRHGADGEVTQLTSGSWPVSSIDCVDAEDGELYFTGWRDNALESHIFRMPLDGEGEIERVTTAKGSHGGSFGAGCDTFIHRYSSLQQPPQASVASAADGSRRFWLVENALDDDHAYSPYLESHRDWTFGTIEAEDGQVMDYMLLTPEGDGPFPAIQLVYGGPHVQIVANRWNPRYDLYAQLLADRGFAVFKLDNRGASNRGKAFEDVLYRRMGQPEVADQAVGTEWLAARPEIDGDRIGVQGWSYGGYMTLMMLGQRPDLYAAGASGAPVTDWRTYDTAYTERYMGDPREVADKYDAASVLTYVDGIEDDALLLIHGMADDNVIFQNAIDVMAALQARGTSFDLMTYPGEKHGFRQQANQIHRDRTTVQFFEERLDLE